MYIIEIVDTFFEKLRSGTRHLGGRFRAVFYRSNRGLALSVLV